MNISNKEKITFILGTWHLLPQYKNQLDVLIRYLTENQKMKIEFNSHIPESIVPDLNIKTIGDLTAIDASAYLISEGIDSSRVICAQLSESKIPMYRLVKDLILL